MTSQSVLAEHILAGRRSRMESSGRNEENSSVITDIRYNGRLGQCRTKAITEELFESTHFLESAGIFLAFSEVPTRWKATCGLSLDVHIILTIGRLHPAIWIFRNGLPIRYT